MGDYEPDCMNHPCHPKSEHPPAHGGSCPIESNKQTQFPGISTHTVKHTRTPIIKVPVVLAEPTLQIVLEADIKLQPPASEIKRVKKHVFLDQIELIPVAFKRIDRTDYFYVTRAKLFVAGTVRKNIEYATKDCTGTIQDRIANVPFTGFAELHGDICENSNGFHQFPIIGISESSEANFLNEKSMLDARLDKAFFQNLVKYNEQPFGELLAANFYELDFSPAKTPCKGTFSRLREKLVLDLTVKILQTQQFKIIGAQQILPKSSGHHLL